MFLEESYGVYFGSQMAGKVCLQRQGLYYRFRCRCQLSGDIVCRLNVRCGDKQESLGVVVPMDGGFGLDTKLPVKRLGIGEMIFTLVPKHEISGGSFIRIRPEEPFSYIARLKKSYLVRRYGEMGIMVQQDA